ncbi:riboflavin synthase [Altibacter sp. HG106]|uniref:riboflavin synthase n=1 Tax=Altibacter sp. HG106 TaxID=3023937 RepID=UPI0023500780|nr:riboflavin synthase [Altibacter sp. HG106]MDC7994951.1 riboflavin synthase [Altibacter sp. HG106]
MFTGIVETVGRVKKLVSERENLHITVESSLATELKIDQSVSHNGVCLTVVDVSATVYTVTAIRETLVKSNLGELQKGSPINLERAMKLGDRLDGHLVQGHVDQTATCVAIEEAAGSTIFTFTYDASKGNITVEKGSITVNGVSLTVVNSEKDRFSVAIIPYTLAHTTFRELADGTRVNLEFDVIGKYVSRIMQAYR